MLEVSRLKKARLGAMIGICLLSMLCAGSALAAPLARQRAAHSKWLSVNTKSKTATLTLIAAYNDTNSGYNFDGYASGKMIVTIPVKWKVHVKCTTSSSAQISHSCAITKSLTATKPAFSHAEVPNATQGLTPGSSASFTFIPTKVGTYRIMCLVPTHADAGMWDYLKVVAKGSPTINVK